MGGVLTTPSARPLHKHASTQVLSYNGVNRIHTQDRRGGVAGVGVSPLKQVTERVCYL